MKKKAMVSTVLLAMGMMSVAHADNAAQSGSGRVTFRGSMINAACSINPESSDQEVNLGQIAAHQLENSGTSTPRNFEIALENCSLEESNAVTITFGGAAADGSHQLLGITGTASGAGVAITDGSGNMLTLGKASEARELIEGDNTLIFSAYLKGLSELDPRAAGIKTGDFYAVTNFTLAYQ